MKKALAFPFVLDALEAANPYTKPMFGCIAVYVGEKIVLILRDRESSPEDNGVWIATTKEHHESLQKDFPSMRSIYMFADGGPTGWQVLPASSEDFEESAMKACEFILRKDPRIGNVPKAKKPKTKKSKKPSSQKPKKKAGKR
jgi:hypothetical protein